MILNGEAAKNTLQNILNNRSFSLSKGYFQDNKIWIGFDNSTKDCWVEEFNNEDLAICWLENFFEISEINTFQYKKLDEKTIEICGEGYLTITKSTKGITNTRFLKCNS